MVRRVGRGAACARAECNQRLTPALPLLRADRLRNKLQRCRGHIAEEQGAGGTSAAAPHADA